MRNKFLYCWEKQCKVPGYQDTVNMTVRFKIMVLGMWLLVAWQIATSTLDEPAASIFRVGELANWEGMKSEGE